ncbi:MAG: SCO family protein [Geminicoccaceae bacterium]|nr:MAG: SCO family protein [Geminicoccaceae bacterium]
MSGLQRVRLVLWGIAAVTLVALALVWWTKPQPTVLVESGRALVGGPFTLVDARGDVVTDADFQGKPFAVFFGFTHCPDICPTALWEMTLWIDALGDDADRMRFAFVTVDPARDTPEVMGAYVGSFTDRIVPLTGSAEQIEAIVRAYRVYARKVPLENGDYTMDHSTMVYLMDEAGGYVAHIPHGESVERAVARLRELVRS